MLMRRAVPVVRQRVALARRPPPRGGAALQRIAVGVIAVAGLPGEPLVGGREIGGDDPPDPRLGTHREVHPDVVEQRPGRPREVVAVGHEALYALLAGPQHGLMPAAPYIATDLTRKLAIDGATELVHRTCFLPNLCEGENAANVDLALRVSTEIGSNPPLPAGFVVASDDGVAQVERRIALGMVGAAMGAARLGTRQRAGGDQPHQRVLVVGEPSQALGGAHQSGVTPQRLARRAVGQWDPDRLRRGAGIGGQWFAERRAGRSPPQDEALAE